MPIVEVRKFLPNGNDWTQHNLQNVSINLAKAIAANATAAHRPRLTNFAIFVAEVRLLWSGLHKVSGQNLRVKAEVRGASSNVQNFITEGAALAITTTLATEYGWKLIKGLPIHFDLLNYGAGLRPDLKFPIGGGLEIAGESRGRTLPDPQKPPKEPPNSKQRARLAQLSQWQANNYGSQWFMAWSWFASDKTTVDFFDPGSPQTLDPAAATVANRIISRLWDTAPQLNERLFDRETRGIQFRLDLFGESDDNAMQVLILMFAEPLPPQIVDQDRLEFNGVELAVSSRMIVLTHRRQTMSIAEVSSLLT